MLGSQLVQDVGGIEAGVVTELPGNDLKGFSVSSYQQLLLARNGPGVVAEVFGELHLYRATAGNHRVILEEKGKRGDARTPVPKTQTLQAQGKPPAWAITLQKQVETLGWPLQQQLHPMELSQEGMADCSLSRAAQVSLIFVKPSELKIFAAALGSQVLLPAIFSPSLSASVERDRDVLSKARTVPKVLTCFLLTGKKKHHT